MRQDDFVGKIVSFAKTDDTVENIVLACNVKFLFINENSVAVIASEYALSSFPALLYLSFPSGSSSRIRLYSLWFISSARCDGEMMSYGGQTLFFVSPAS